MPLKSTFLVFIFCFTKFNNFKAIYPKNHVLFSSCICANVLSLVFCNLRANIEFGQSAPPDPSGVELWKFPLRLWKEKKTIVFFFRFDEEMSHLVTIMNELQITLPIYLGSPAQKEEYWTPSWYPFFHFLLLLKSPSIIRQFRAFFFCFCFEGKSSAYTL